MAKTPRFPRAVEGAGSAAARSHCNPLCSSSPRDQNSVTRSQPTRRSDAGSGQSCTRNRLRPGRSNTAQLLRVGRPFHRHIAAEGGDLLLVERSTGSAASRLDPARTALSRMPPWLGIRRACPGSATTRTTMRTRSRFILHRRAKPRLRGDRRRSPARSLGFYGGFTQTMRPLAGSPALNAAGGCTFAPTSAVLPCRPPPRRRRVPAWH